MNSSIVILIVVVALAVAWYLWSRRDKQPTSTGGSGTTPGATATPKLAPATVAPASGALGSYDEYRRVSPSNMRLGKLTCNRCGSNLIATTNSTASCSNCGAALYRT